MDGPLLVVLAALATAHAFNFAPEFARIESDPSAQKGSYFGMSVALRNQSDDTGTTAWLMVGASRGNQTHFPTMVRPGVLYKCGVHGPKSCAQFVLDTERLTVIRNDQTNIWSDKTDAAIGSAIDVQDNGNGVIACGPLWKSNMSASSLYMNGICYWLNNTSSPEVNQHRIFPLAEDKNKQGYSIKGTKESLYAYAQMGFSVHVAKVNDRIEILTGAPGFAKWRGSVLRHHILNDSSGTLDTSSDISIPEVAWKMEESGYFGYSVSSGKFFPNKVSYVSGAPRTEKYKGKVLIFDYVKNNESRGYWELKVLKERVGTQMGEYFGATLCVADFNNDGLDDLVVGAPQHTLQNEGLGPNRGDEGCVYVFITDEEFGWKTIEEKCPITGSEVQGARFGSAISLIGDANMDGHPDIAIGAPYEKSGSGKIYENPPTGAIYIYHGNKNGLNAKYSQRITAEEISPFLRGFGISISKGFDVDGNNFKDLAVGSYLSEHAVLVKSYPVITMYPILTTNVSQISFSETGFEAFACMLYSGSFAPKTANITVTVKADLTYKRAHFGDSTQTKVYTFNASLEFEVRYCKNLTVKIEGASDYSKPIELSLEYKLESPQAQFRPKRNMIPDRSEEFCKFCPVIDPTLNKPVICKVPYSTGCKVESNCKPDLNLKAGFVNTSFPYIIGSSKSLNISINVTNFGESAFLTRVSVMLPRVTPFRRVPKMCQENSTESVQTLQLLCDTSNPLQENMTDLIEIELDTSSVHSVKYDLVYNMSVFSTGTEQNETDNHISLKLPLKSVADILISGKSSQDQIIYASNKNNETVKKDKSFSHKYMVMNDGPSPVKSVLLEFKIPVKVNYQGGTVDVLSVFEPLSYLDGQPFICDHISGPGFSSKELPNRSNDKSVENEENSNLRRRRAIENKNELPYNRTLFLDCSHSDTECLVVQCTVGPLPPINVQAEVLFPMKARLSNLGPLLGRRDIIVVTTSGTVSLAKTSTTEQPEKHKPDETSVQTVFWGKLPDGEVSSWVLAVSIAGGLLLLLLIIMSLVKLGFFKREKQMQLKAMKHKALIGDDCSDS